jgi:hypothetical protein
MDLTDVEFVTAQIVSLIVDISPKCSQSSSLRNDTSALTVRLFTVSDFEM